MMNLSAGEKDLIGIVRNKIKEEYNKNPTQPFGVTLPIVIGNLHFSLIFERENIPESDEEVPSDNKEIESILKVFNEIEENRIEAERLEKGNRERLIAIVDELPDSPTKTRLKYILTSQIEVNTP